MKSPIEQLVNAQNNAVKTFRDNLLKMISDNKGVLMLPVCIPEYSDDMGYEYSECWGTAYITQKSLDDRYICEFSVVNEDTEEENTVKVAYSQLIDACEVSHPEKDENYIELRLS